jgi:hypothetical protein
VQEQHALPAPNKGASKMQHVAQYMLLTYLASYCVYQIASAAWWLVRRLWRAR